MSNVDIEVCRYLLKRSIQMTWPPPERQPDFQGQAKNWEKFNEDDFQVFAKKHGIQPETIIAIWDLGSDKYEVRKREAAVANEEKGFGPPTPNWFCMSNVDGRVCQHAIRLNHRDVAPSKCPVCGGDNILDTRLKINSDPPTRIEGPFKVETHETYE